MAANDDVPGGNGWPGAAGERERLAEIIRNSPSFMGLLRGPGHTFELANDRFRELAGGRDLVGKAIREAMPEVEARWFLDRLDRVDATGEPIAESGVRLLLERVPGGPPEERFVDIVFQALLGPDGATSGILIQGVDQTERRRVDEALVRVRAEAKTRRRLYETILSNTPDLAYVFDLEHRFVYANEGLLAMWGKTWDEAIGKTCLELGYPDWHAAMHGREIEQVKATKRPVRGDVPFSGTFGRRIYDYILVPVLGDDGEVEAVAGTTRDVTDYKLAEERAQAGERRFRDMADAAPAMLWVTEPDGSCSFLSRGWYEFTGQAEVEGLGFGWTDAIHPDDRKAGHDAFVAANAGRSEYVAEYRLRTADGAYRWVIDAGRPRVAAGGEHLGYIGSVIDIDGRKRAEDERGRHLEDAELARSEAEAANRMKDEFLAMLSHELRTPLNAIMGWTKLLRAGGLDDEDASEGLEVIDRNAQAQAQLIEDLLDVSRIVSGKLALDYRRVDLRDLVGAALAAVRPAADMKGVALDSGPAMDVGTVLGDPARLQQVVWNLLDNAVKFTPKGGTVRVLLARPAGRAEIRVEDDGLGIAAEFLPHVFDRFRQADGSTTRRHGGLGLGLAIVKQIVDHHGGGVRVESAGEGRGATFVVSLPIESDSEGRAEPEGRPTASWGDIRGLRILIVDDEEDVRILLGRLLGIHGAATETAESVDRALEAIDRAPPDVLISDIGMPVRDGYDLIRRVRERHDDKALPAIALTAFARDEDRLRSLQAGFQIHLSKPLVPDELVAVIAALAARPVSTRR